MSSVDFEYTINSLNWFMPWFKDYAMNTALLKISFLISSISLFLLILLNFFKNIQNIIKKDIKTYLIIMLSLILNIIFWFQAPEIRFGWGTILAIACFPLSVLIFHNKLNEKIEPSLYKYITILFMFILVADNSKNFTVKNLYSPYGKNFNYSKIEKFYSSGDKDFYKSLDRQCYDFQEICVNTPKEKYSFITKFNYLIFLNNN